MSVKEPVETIEAEVSYTAYDELAKLCRRSDLDEDAAIEALLIEHADSFYDD
jgi:hypothetical protein